MRDIDSDEKPGKWYYQQLCLGYNYRLSDLQAALGISQLSRIDSFIESRRQLVERYLDKLKALPIILPQANELSQSSWHLFMIELTEHDRKQVFDALHEKGVAVNVHYIPIHLHPYYQDLGFSEGQFPNAERFYNNALTLPLYVGLSQQQQDVVIKALSDVLKDK
jgi:dTDP-4-amino-4,6-dideoxygalactose transaminase